jgi:two-component system, OmpR family, sensor kinase
LELGVDRVIFEGPKELYVDVEPGQIRSAIANVVRNALMYSPSGSPVGVRIEPSSRAAQVVVQDRGPGIPLTERDHVFDPFSRGDVGRSSQRGSGLGLFIARRVLEAHGGTISLRSSRSGARFVLEIPSMDERRERSAS